MRRKIATILFFLLGSLAAQAGPWARERGATFLSLSYSATSPTSELGANLGHYAALYAEHGVTANTTLGLNAGIDQTGHHTAILFLRRPIPTGSGRTRLSYQIGAGSTDTGGSTDAILQAGLSAGHGFDTKFGPGWFAIDAQVQHRVVSGNTVAKADLTVGFKPRSDLKFMLQIQTGAYPGSDPYVRLAPSMVKRISPRTHIEIGSFIGVLGDDRIGFKIGTWIAF